MKTESVKVMSKHLKRKKQQTRTGPAGRCDFCMVNEAKHTINGGLWWICAACFEETYGGEEE